MNKIETRIIKLENDVTWIKRISYYVSSILTIQLITNIMGVIK